MSPSNCSSLKSLCRWETCALIVLIFLQAASQDRKTALASILPRAEAVQGWSRVDTPKIYEGEDLFNFVDGGAVLFFEYGFLRALAMEFQNARGESINLEIYEMKDPCAAYGIYSVRSTVRPIPIAIGQEGSAQSHYIMFWKGNYFVSLAASDSTMTCQAGTEAMGREVARNILEKGERPPVTNLLPQEGLLKTSYVRGNLGLSTAYVFDSKDVFQSTEAAVGIYTNLLLLILKYDNVSSASLHLKQFADLLRVDNHYRNYRSDAGITTALDKKERTLCVLQTGPYMVICISAQPSVAMDSCRSITTSLSHR